MLQLPETSRQGYRLPAENMSNYNAKILYINMKYCPTKWGQSTPIKTVHKLLQTLHH